MMNRSVELYCARFGLKSTSVCDGSKFDESEISCFFLDLMFDAFTPAMNPTKTVSYTHLTLPTT